MSEVTKSVVLPVELAGELEALASASERSFGAEVRVAAKAHVAASRDLLTVAPSGFSLDDALALGFRVVRAGEGGPDHPQPWLAEGHGQAVGGTSLRQVLIAIENWHLTRVAAGVAASPVPIETTGGKRAVAAKKKPVAAGDDTPIAA